MQKITHLLICVAASLASLPTAADTTLVYATGSNDYVIKIRPGEIRIDDEGKRWQLYREQANAFYSIDPEARAYTRMDADDAAAIRQKMRDLREQMNAQLQKLPPEQRSQARAMLAQQVPGFDQSKHAVSIQRTGNNGSVAGHDCRQVRVLRDGKARESLCVATPQTLGISGEEFETVEAMFALMQKMLAGTGFEHVSLPYLNLKGMPIRFQEADSGQTRVLKRVSHDSLPDLAFRIPSGYSEHRPSKPD